MVIDFCNSKMELINLSEILQGLGIVYHKVYQTYSKYISLLPRSLEKSVIENEIFYNYSWRSCWIKS